jgi:triacylglycerol esterase/lipase EstA (alpha/beta hydrolase family)
MSLLALALALPAHATRSFDATRPQASFDGQECYTQEGDIRLWSRVERLADPDRGLFVAETFNDVTAWPAESNFAPWIADMFGTATPHSSSFLLHVGPNAEFTRGTPILMVPGAADNASRGFVTMAARMDLRGRPVYAMTFAHPHGDVFRHAEAIADAIARVKADTGADQVDVVAHSKGGVELAVYLANTASAEWGDTPSAQAYEAVGTAYRGDVRKAVFIATPLSGIDTGFRWTNANLLGLSADTALSPSSWSAYYPYTTVNWAVSTDLSAQDFLPADGDLFPGQRQLLARQDHELPGSNTSLGLYALQLDWYTTYEGGTGYYSTSDGIDAAIDAGGDVLGHLASNGADPGVRLYTLAGTNPLMPNGTGDYLGSVFGEAFGDLSDASTNTWSNLLADLVGDGLVENGVAREEVQGLASGALVLGEVSGPSDGLVFVESATSAEALTARGARIVDSAVKNLSHIDLLYASPITGGLLVDAADDAAGNTWMAAVGARYIAEDSLGWVENALAEDDTGGSDTGDTGGDDTGGNDTGEDTASLDTATTDDSGDVLGEAPEDKGGAWGGCEGCAGTGADPRGFTALALGLAVIVGRRRR